MEHLHLGLLTDYHGYPAYSFSVAGHVGLVVLPEGSETAPAFVWRTEFLGAFDYADREMLRRGYPLVTFKISDLYGSPKAVGLMKEFFDFLTGTLRLPPRTVLFGFSRGGLYAVNFAAAFPDYVAALYLDAPVLDFRTWPCSVPGAERERAECLKEYGLTDQTLASTGALALDRAEFLASRGIPLLVVAGREDRVVPIAANADLFVQRYRKAGGRAEYLVKEHCDHHPHSLEDPTPIADFLEQVLSSSR